eukprot:GFYU01011131.1.p1 GENE.GFYU01011131.1~~GFYU01011131.1.p1  ORF type:complete len:263 (-),score=101.96 GFYU01011131.1:81-824(-)
MTKNTEIIALFDVDGTLTLPRKKVTQETLDFMAKLREKITIGVVGGSDFPKQKEQLGDDCTSNFDWNFAENGLTGFKAGVELPTESLKKFLGEEKIKKFLNFCLRYLSEIDVPVKRGNFIEFRNGMLNISPCGRNVNQEERDAFEQFDKTAGVRAKFVEDLKKEFADFGLTYSIGGQISFDVFPTGWDKTYCLRHLASSNYKEIHFFGDKTSPGGNDYEIFASDATIGHTVTSPEDTVKQCKELFGL